MSWVVWLVLAVIVAAVAAVTGIQPKGARPVARTSLMGVARFTLAAIAVICVLRVSGRLRRLTLRRAGAQNVSSAPSTTK